MLKWTTTFLSVCLSYPCLFPASDSILASFSTSEVKSAIGSLSDDETTSFSVVHLDLRGKGSESGGLFESGKSAIVFFTITAEILARSLANFYR